MDLVSALLEVAGAGAWRLTDFIGFSAWLLFALVFLVPGWLITTFRRRVVIDRDERAVEQVNAPRV